MPSIRSRRRLPHWEADDAIYFVTFRLSDSLPESVVERIQFERHDIIATARSAHRELSLSEHKRLKTLFGEHLDANLDRGAGQCFLANPAVADVVAESLLHFHLKRYLLYAWCVMPNHVHVLFRLLLANDLAAVLHSWKSYSAKKANRLLLRSGEFWQREYFDHLVRSEDEFHRLVAYILQNPEKAGLHDWRWCNSHLDS
ncbi:MAG: transposase [Candidatus Acidiferrales bacterium]